MNKEIKKVKIISVVVNKFRNIKNAQYTINAQNVAFVGNNRLGKTNLLNAIYWCLTGVDLENKSDDRKNIPFDEKGEDYLLDVSVYFNEGDMIQRKAKLVKGALKQEIIVNNIPYEKSNDGEIAIDKMLGILEHTIITTKDFNIRRFMLNPNYINCGNVKESAFRSFITRFIEDKVDKETLLTNLMNDTQKQEIEYLLHFTDFNIVNAYKLVDDKIKEAKKSVEYWKVVLSYLKTYQPTNETDRNNALKEQLEANKNFAYHQQTKVVLDRFTTELSKAYDNVCKQYFKGMTIKLIEKGVGEEVWKECCYIHLDNGTPYQLCSTSEKLSVATQFLCAFIDTYQLSKLPVLLDECETFDNNSLKEFTEKVNTQLIITKVVSNDTNKITMERI